MGSGASKSASPGVEVISPRVQNVGKKKKDQGKVVLDSSPLGDVGPGTIRYRYQQADSVANIEKNENVQLGYFYHPKLKDYSELGNPDEEESYKFVRVMKGPNNMLNKNVFYACGVGFDGSKERIPPVLTEGKGGRIYGHKYFNVTFVEDQEDDENFIQDVGIAGNEIRIKILKSLKMIDVKRKAGNHLICPVGIIHLNSGEKELSDDDLVCDVMEVENEEDVVVARLVSN